MLAFDAPIQRDGAWLFGVGSALDLASWLPLLLAPGSAWSRGLVGGLAPAYTPLPMFLGIAMIGQSPAYGMAASAFVVAHVAATACKLGAAG
ncbi:MAG: hypothetical protein ACFCGT_18255 [Sandaracinaceae bacterium]